MRHINASSKKFVIKIYIQFEILRACDLEFPPSFLHSDETLISDNPPKRNIP